MHLPVTAPHSLAPILAPGNGTVLSWGRGEDGQLGHGDAEERTRPEAIYSLMSANCSAVYSGAEYSVAVSQAHDAVYSWGWCVGAGCTTITVHALPMMPGWFATSS